MSCPECPDRRGTVSRSKAGPSPARTPLTASSISPAALIGSDPSPSSTRSPRKALKLRAMSPPGVCCCEGTDIPYPLSSMKKSSGRSLGGRDIERRPESVGRGRCIPAVGDRDTARILRLAERAVPVAQRLGPASRRRVLGTDPPAHGQRAGPLAARKVEHHTDVAAFAHAAHAHHARGERLIDRQSQGQQQRP